MAKSLTRLRGAGETPIEDLSGLRIKAKTREELDLAEFRNNLKAVQKHLLKRPSPKSVSLTYRGLCRIHRDMFGEVWSWAGEKRKSAKNLGAVPAKIGFEINRFLFDFHQWEEAKMPPIEIATRIHHRLVSVHPFENGNGRWARLVANLYLHQRGQPLVEWPQDKKLIREVFKPAYLSALKSADHGDYGPLLKLHHEFSSGGPVEE